MVTDTNRDERIFSAEIFIVRLMIVVYFALAHFAIFIFWFSGLKIAYVNHMPWPYKKMWRDFCGMEVDYDDD